MRESIHIPVSTEDDYLLRGLDTNRRLKAFNTSLRGVSVPVGDFHKHLHEQVIFDIKHNDREMISHLSNIYSCREPRYKATVLELFKCPINNCIMAKVDWLDDIDPPNYLRVTAVMKGNRCLRVMQFGV